MKNAAMREKSRRFKNKQRRSRDSRSYDRPQIVFFDGKNFELDPTLYGERPVSVHPHSRLKSLLQNNPESPDWVPDGLAEDPIYRRFDYDRAQWRRQGFTSPYRNVSDRKARYENEFNLWLYWHPHQERFEEELYLRHEARSGRPGDHRNRGNDKYWEGKLPMTGRGAVYGRGQRRYPGQRFDHDQGRRSHRGHQTVDIRDPRNRPPPPTEIHEVLGDGEYEVPGGRDGPPRIVHGIPIGRDLPSYHGAGAYDVSGDRAMQRQLRHGNHLPRRGGGHLRVYDGYVSEDPDEPTFIPRRTGLYPHGEDGGGEEEEDTTSQHSNRSFVRSRISPQIIFPNLHPYHGRPLEHRRRNAHHQDDTDDEDEDEHIRRRGGNIERRRGLHGVGRERGHWRPGRRSYEDERLDYGFSGDEDDDYDL